MQNDTDGDGITDGVITSPTITLLAGTEPTGEPGKATNADDDNSDFTIDFGLQKCDIVVVCPDPIVEECIEDFVPLATLDATSCCDIASTMSTDPVIIGGGTTNCAGTVYEVTYTVTDNCDTTVELSLIHI